jgi:murein DD-endopeptidase MepM/ murein hydrolase activator NlpD
MDAWTRDRRGATTTATLLGLVLVALLLAAGGGTAEVLAATSRPTALRLEVAPAAVTAGEPTTLTATLVRVDTSGPLAGRTVRFVRRRPGAGEWQAIGTATTDRDGRARLRAHPKSHMEYRAGFRAADGWERSRSAVRQVRVSFAVTARLGADTVRLGRATDLTGTVRPSQAGRTVRLQRHTRDGWKVVDSQRLAEDATYRFRVRPTSGGTVRYRVVTPADDDHDRGVSPRRSLRVRVYVFPVRPPRDASYPRAHHDYPATDIFAPCGTRVVAPTAGTIQEVSRTDRWDPAINAGPTRGGLSVSLVGRDGVRYYGSHFEQIEEGVAPGVEVAAGQQLGTVGRTGSARDTPCHLHFGISPPCGTGDWQVRRGVVWPWPYLDAWREGTDRSPRSAVQAWADANPDRCPAG